MTSLFEQLIGKIPQQDPDLVKDARTKYKQTSEQINTLFQQGGFTKVAVHDFFTKFQSNPFINYPNVIVPSELIDIRKRKTLDEITSSVGVLAGATESYYLVRKVPFALGKILFYANEFEYNVDELLQSRAITPTSLFESYRAYLQYNIFEQMRRNNDKGVLTSIAKAGLLAEDVLEKFSKDNLFDMDKWDHRAVIRRYKQIFKEEYEKEADDNDAEENEAEKNYGEVVKLDTLPFELFLWVKSYNERRIRSTKNYMEYGKQEKPEIEIALQLEHFFYSSDETDLFLERALGVAEKHDVDIHKVLENRNKLLSTPERQHSNLEEKLLRELERKQITFTEFFNQALYNSNLGFYNTVSKLAGTWNSEFKTIPHVYDEFGEIVAHNLKNMWEELGRPTKFNVVEMGAGEGKLAKDILTYVNSQSSEQWRSFLSSLQYDIIEKNSTLLERQKQALAGLKVVLRKESALDLPYLDNNIVGCFLSNELVDAFAPHKVKVIESELKEIYVTALQGALIEVSGAISDTRIRDYLRNNEITLKEGEEAYINLAGLDWLKGVLRVLKRGFVLTFDYGAPTKIIYSTDKGLPQLRAYGKRVNSKREEYEESLGNAILQPKIESYVQHPLSMAGCKDLTTDVDFGSLKRCAEEHGLSERFFGTQNDFLRGICERTGYILTNQKVLQEGLRYKTQLFVKD